MPPTKHSVRVRIREITYATVGKNILDQPTVEYKTAYGPGRPEIDPANLFGPNVDVESDEYKTAVENHRKGERVDLLDEDYIRLKNGGAVLDEDEADAAILEAEQELLDVRTASVEDLSRWIETEHPTVNDVVQASGGEGDLAQKLLEAETMATEGEPRKGVLDGLSTVIGRG